MVGVTSSAGNPVAPSEPEGRSGRRRLQPGSPFPGRWGCELGPAGE